MDSLRNLDLNRTALKELPYSMENLIGLRTLRLEQCENPVYLPESFYKLKSLLFLYVDGCTNLVIWPDNLFSAIGGASSSSIGRPEIQKDLQGLSSLLDLDLSGTNLENLPATIKQSNRLQRLILWKCKRLKSLPELPPSLIHLDAHDCTSLEEVSSIKTHFEQALLFKDKPYGTKILAFIFTNCFLLELQMLFGHMVTILKDYHQASPQRTKSTTCVPGSEIPEWFDFKSLGSSINIQLPSEWYRNSRKNFTGFVFSGVVSFQDYSEEEFNIGCESHLKSSDGDCHNIICYFTICARKVLHGSRSVRSDHLFLVYDDEEVRRFVETQALDKCIYNEASFKFYPVVWDRKWSQCFSCEVKQCGVHLLFAKDDAEVQPPKRLKYIS